MRTILDKLISIRISSEEHQTYQRAAADVGLSLSEYLRLRLVSIGDDYVADQIAQLRLTLLDNTQAQEVETAAATIETLLLLRRLCKPAELHQIHNELTRLGYTPWTPPTPPSQR